MAKVMFRSDLFVVTEDPEEQQLSVEFLGGRGFNLVPTRFTLLPSERHLFSNAGYIGGLIKAYCRDPVRFRMKRHVEEI
jgi:hypothetical protein